MILQKSKIGINLKLLTFLSLVFIINSPANARYVRKINFGNGSHNVNLSAITYGNFNGADGADGDLSSSDGKDGQNGQDGPVLIISGEALVVTGNINLSGGNGGKGGGGRSGQPSETYNVCDSPPGAGGNGGHGGSGGILIFYTNEISFQGANVNVSGGSGGNGGSGGGKIDCEACLGCSRDGGVGGDGARPGYIEVTGCRLNEPGNPPPITVISNGGSGGNGGRGGGNITFGHCPGNGGDGGKAYICAETGGAAIPGQGGSGGVEENTACIEGGGLVYGDEGDEGGSIIFPCPTLDYSGPCPGPQDDYGDDWDTGWEDYTAPEPDSPFAPPPPAPGPEGPPPPPGPSDPSPDSPLDPPPSICEDCGTSIPTDSIDLATSLSCGSIVTDQFITTAGQSYCSPIYVPGETTLEESWADRVWSITPAADTLVTIRAYSYFAPYILAVGKSGNLSSEGFVRKYGQYSSDITFLADGSTYYITLEAWLCFERFKLQVICSENKVVKMSGGAGHVTALLDNGKLYAWGDSPNFASAGPLEKSPVPIYSQLAGTIVDADSNFQYTGAITKNGKVWLSGYNNGGVLGRSTSLSHSDVPIPLMEADGVTTFTKAKTQYDSLACGESHAAVIGKDNKIYTWGLNYAGALGDGLTPCNCSYRSYPATVKNSNLTDFNPGSPIVQLEAGGNFSLALLNDGTVWSWGYGEFGALGNLTNYASSSHPKIVVKSDGTTLTTIISIAAGSLSGYALSQGGEVYSWGYNDYGGLGDGTYSSRDWASKVLSNSSDALTSVTKLYAQYLSAVAITSENKVFGWGSNELGALGLGILSVAEVYPVQLTLPPGTIPRLGYLGWQDGGLISNLTDRFAWGTNQYGTVGNGTTVDEYSPISIIPGL